MQTFRPFQRCTLFFACAVAAGVAGGCNPRNFNEAKNKSVFNGSAVFKPVATWSGYLIAPLAGKARRSVANENPDGGVFIQLENAPPEHAALKGKKVWLRFKAASPAGVWGNEKNIRKAVAFSDDTRKSMKDGNVHPVCIDGLGAVSPLESLAAGRLSEGNCGRAAALSPFNEAQAPELVTVALPGAVGVISERHADSGAEAIVEIESEPVQVNGSAYTLVKFQGVPLTGLKDITSKERTKRIEVSVSPAQESTGGSVKFSSQLVKMKIEHPTFQFDPAAKRVFAPRAYLSDLAQNGHASELAKTPQSPGGHNCRHSSCVNPKGWFVYGRQNPDDAGTFLIEAMEPRDFLQAIAPDKEYVFNSTQESKAFFEGTAEGLFKRVKKNGYWPEKPSDLDAGGLEKHVLRPQGGSTPVALPSVPDEKARGLLVHVFGGIGGKHGDGTSLATGHFAYGVVSTYREPITKELRFDLEYKQVYAHGPDGILAGSMKWHNYTGGLRRGWVYPRPVADAVIYHPALYENIEIEGKDGKALVFNALDGVVSGGDPNKDVGLLAELEKMMARFRIGNGDGLAVVGPWESCVQDSNKALFVALARFNAWLVDNVAPDATSDAQAQAMIRDLVSKNAGDPNYQRLGQLVNIVFGFKDLFTSDVNGRVRNEWREFFDTGDIPPSSQRSALGSVVELARSPYTVLPRRGFDKAVSIFLDNGAQVWLLRSNGFVGGRPPKGVPPSGVDVFPLAPSKILRNH